MNIKLWIGENGCVHKANGVATTGRWNKPEKVSGDKHKPAKSIPGEKGQFWFWTMRFGKRNKRSGCSGYTRAL